MPINKIFTISVLNWYNNNMVVKIFIIGWVILIVALIVNGVALKIGIDTWYSFAGEISRTGFKKAFLNTSFFAKVFLFVLYPLILGVSAWAASRILHSN